MAINADAVALWLDELQADEATYQHYLPLLSAEERKHAGQLSRPLLQQRYVAVRGRLRHILAQYLQQAPAQITIQKSAHGKPYLADYPNLAFNLSHTDAYLAIAISGNCRIGVDIERIKPRPNMPQLVAKCFADDEAAYWHSLPEAEKTLAFYRFWTQKEAFVKATGRGIALGLSQCVVCPAKSPVFKRLPAEYAPTGQWRILAIPLPSQSLLCGAVVIDKAVSSIDLHNENPRTVLPIPFSAYDGKNVD